MNRTVEGSPYLDFIYTHLDYPFGVGSTKPVQLHGLGMSLLNRLCAELKVSVRKATATLSLRFEAGRLVHNELIEVRTIWEDPATSCGVITRSKHALR